MRRYSVILMATIAMLATSCKISDGNADRQPIDIGKAIASEAHQQLAQTNFIIRLVLMSDAYYATEDEAVRAKILEEHFTDENYSLNRDEDKGVIVISYGTTTIMNIHCDGGLLSDGGVWSVDDSYLAKYTPTDRGIEVDIDFFDGYTYSGSSDFVVSNVVYDVENDLTYNLTGSMELIFGSSDTHRLSTVITRELSYSRQLYQNGEDYYYRYVGFFDGAMSVQYVDAMSKVFDVRMTYKDSETIDVEYCGEYATINNYTFR